MVLVLALLIAVPLMGFTYAYEDIEYDDPTPAVVLHTISTIAEFREFATTADEDLLSANWVLLNDLDFANEPSDWSPIGNMGEPAQGSGTPYIPFTGVFDGNGFSILNFTGGGEGRHFGIFRVIGESGIVRNLGVTTRWEVVPHAYLPVYRSLRGVTAGSSGILTRDNHGLIYNVSITDALFRSLSSDSGIFAHSNFGIIRNSFSTAIMNDSYHYSVSRRLIAQVNTGSVEGVFVDRDIAGRNLRLAGMPPLDTPFQAFSVANATIDSAVFQTTEWLQTAQNLVDADWDTTVWQLADGYHPQLIHGSSPFFACDNHYDCNRTYIVIPTWLLVTSLVGGIMILLLVAGAISALFRKVFAKRGARY